MLVCVCLVSVYITVRAGWTDNQRATQPPASAPSGRDGLSPNPSRSCRRQPIAVGRALEGRGRAFETPCREQVPAAPTQRSEVHRKEATTRAPPSSDRKEEYGSIGKGDGEGPRRGANLKFNDESTATVNMPRALARVVVTEQEEFMEDEEEEEEDEEEDEEEVECPFLGSISFRHGNEIGAC